MAISESPRKQDLGHDLGHELGIDWPPMGGRRTNLALFALLAAAFATGWISFSLVSTPARVTLVVHALAGVGIALLLPWKTALSSRALQRRRPIWWASIVFGILLFASLVGGFLHSFGRPYLGLGIDLTAMEVHVGAAIALVPFAAWHTWARWVRPRPTDLVRRNVLRAGALLGAGGIGYVLLPSAARAATGSYELGSRQPQLLPSTQWMFDSVPGISLSEWQLHAAGRTWSYDELAVFADELTATIDCTGGWYSEQDWQGARVDRLLERTRTSGVESFVVRSRTGYSRRFPIADAARMLLATRVGGNQLDAAHGFPARLVVPGRRGFEWVKWVDRIELDELPAWWQSPFPLQ